MFHQMSVVHLSVGAVWRLVRVVCNAFPFLSVFCVVRIFLSFISKTPSLLIKLTILSFSRALHGGVYFQGIIFDIDQPTFGKRSCFLAVLVCLCHSYGQKCLWFHRLQHEGDNFKFDCLIHVCQVGASLRGSQPWSCPYSTMLMNPVCQKPAE